MPKLLRHILTVLLVLVACLFAGTTMGAGSCGLKAQQSSYAAHVELKRRLINADAYFEAEASFSFAAFQSQLGQQFIWLASAEAYLPYRDLFTSTQLKNYQRNTRLTLFYRLLLFPFHVFW